MRALTVWINGVVFATARLEGFGVLTASLVRTVRNPARLPAGASAASAEPELSLRLGGVHHHEQHDEGFTVAETGLTVGDRIRLQLGAEVAVSTPRTRPAGVAGDLRFGVRLNGAEHLVTGQAGYGMLIALLVWAHRHPSRCVKKNGEVLAAEQLELQLAAQDSNAANVTYLHQWPPLTLAPSDVIELDVLGAGIHAEPDITKTHEH